MGTVLLPHDTFAEEGLLSAIVSGGKQPDGAIMRLRPEDFYVEKHESVFRSICALFAESQPINFVSVCHQMEKFGTLNESGIGNEDESFLMKYSKRNAPDISSHIEIVAEKANRRKLFYVGKRLATASLDLTESLNDVVSDTVMKIESSSTDDEAKIVSMKSLAEKHMERVQEFRDNGGKPVEIAIQTGFGEIDDIIGGLAKSNLIVVAARPGMGKTSFILNVARSSAVHGNVSVIASLEMPPDQLFNRLVASATGIDSKRLDIGEIYEHEENIYYDQVGRLSESSIYIIDAQSLSPFKMRTLLRAFSASYGLDALFIDYLQLMDSDKQSQREYDVITAVSRDLKKLAREFAIPVVALAQLSRAVENRMDKRPTLADLRGSGSIEQDSDIVAFLYRDDYYNPDTTMYPGVAEFIIAKNRHGATGMVNLLWTKESMKFSSMKRQDIYLDSRDDPNNGNNGY